jgi:UMF1 family MFS transporter
VAGVGPGDLALAVVAVVLSNVFYSPYGEALIAAFLPELARRDALGRVSGWGWSFGYFGGMLALGISLAYVLWAQGQGLKATHFVPVTMLITAGIYAVASLVTFALLGERAVPQPGGAPGRLAASLRRLGTPWRQARALSRLRGAAGLRACSTRPASLVVIALAAVYAEQALGFKQTETMLLVFLVNIAAAGGAFAFGYWQDRIGQRRALGLTLLGWLVMIALAWAARGRACSGWRRCSRGCAWAAASRRGGRWPALAPAERRAEFFGLWTFATRLAAIVGPLTYGLVTWATAGNHRLAILSTGLFFVVGWVLLRNVDVERGRAAANAPLSPSSLPPVRPAMAK